MFQRTHCRARSPAPVSSRASRRHAGDASPGQGRSLRARGPFLGMAGAAATAGLISTSLDPRGQRGARRAAAPPSGRRANGRPACSGRCRARRACAQPLGIVGGPGNAGRAVDAQPVRPRPPACGASPRAVSSRTRRSTRCHAGRPAPARAAPRAPTSAAARTGTLRTGKRASSSASSEGTSAGLRIAAVSFIASPLSA